MGQPCTVCTVSYLSYPKRNQVKMLVYIYWHLWREIFPHSCFPHMRTQLCFRKKVRFFIKLTIFFILTTGDLYIKQSTFSECSLKIKVWWPWMFFVVLVTSAVICKQNLLHGNWFFNIFKTTNPMMVVENMSESTYEVLQISWKRTTSKWPLQFSKAILF